MTCVLCKLNLNMWKSGNNFNVFNCYHCYKYSVSFFKEKIFKASFRGNRYIVYIYYVDNKSYIDSDIINEQLCEFNYIINIDINLDIDSQIDNLLFLS